jgi:hypothetical protein
VFSLDLMSSTLTLGALHGSQRALAPPVPASFTARSTGSASFGPSFSPSFLHRPARIPPAGLMSSRRAGVTRQT